MSVKRYREEAIGEARKWTLMKLPNDIWIKIAFMCDTPFDAHRFLACHPQGVAALASCKPLHVFKSIIDEFNYPVLDETDKEFEKRPCTIHWEYRNVVSLYTCRPRGSYHLTPFKNNPFIPQHWIDAFMLRPPFPVGTNDESLYMISNDLMRKELTRDELEILFEYAPRFIQKTARAKYADYAREALKGRPGLEFMSPHHFHESFPDKRPPKFVGVLSDDEIVSIHHKIILHYPEFWGGCEKRYYWPEQEYDKACCAALKVNPECFRYIRCKSDKIVTYALKHAPVATLSAIKNPSDYVILCAFFHYDVKAQNTEAKKLFVHELQRKSTNSKEFVDRVEKLISVKPDDYHDNGGMPRFMVNVSEDYGYEERQRQKAKAEERRKKRKI